jgi:hypothetical protein
MGYSGRGAYEYDEQGHLVNVRLQCVYGGKRSKHSVFRGQELRIRRRKIVRYVLLAVLAVILFFIAYFGADILLTIRNSASSAYGSSAQTTSSAVNSSSGVSSDE